MISLREDITINRSVIYRQNRIFIKEEEEETSRKRKK